MDKRKRKEYKNRDAVDCIENQLDPCSLIIFGASGDLTQRKLIPAIFSIYRRGLLPDNFFIVGCARSELSDDEFRNKMGEALIEEDKNLSKDIIDVFLKRCHYMAGGYDDLKLYGELTRKLETLEEKYGTSGNRVFYLSTPPNLFEPIVNRLGALGLTKEEKTPGNWVRVVVEKPFGHDLDSAMELDRQLYQVLDEHQIYRIDHYLGKETVQNILMFRFANTIFEPVWNRSYIDNVQITVAESLGVGHRAGYFEQSGQLRDMFQNHMMQMLSLVAMEPPSSFDADRVRDEKVKLLRCIRSFPRENLSESLVRGQYGEGEIGDQNVRAYRDEEGVAEKSNVETFVAARVMIDNWRWQGVPFYMRSGKRLPTKISEVVITFKRVPHLMFPSSMPDELTEPNKLILTIQPHEGVSLTFQAKVPGPKLELIPLTLDFHYKDRFGSFLPEAYERLLFDCISGDQTLFIRHDEVKVAWRLLDPVLKSWSKSSPEHEPDFYDSGTWGPTSSNKLLELYGHIWHENKEIEEH